jgi:hypothetical protein
MTLLDFMGKHPVLSVILALIIGQTIVGVAGMLRGRE